MLGFTRLIRADVLLAVQGESTGSNSTFETVLISNPLHFYGRLVVSQVFDSALLEFSLLNCLSGFLWSRCELRFALTESLIFLLFVPLALGEGMSRTTSSSDSESDPSCINRKIFNINNIQQKILRS